MSKYLLEIGTEELPYRFISQAIEQLKHSFKTFFEANKVCFEKVDVLATPRRLAVIVSGLTEQQPDEVKVVKGPIEKVAYDENGNLSKAGEGFLNKNKINAENAYIQDGYLHAKIEIKGRPTVEILQENVPSIVLKLQGSHFMRWGAHEEKFSRPIRWIVSMFENTEVKIKIVDVESSYITRGHRFAQQKIVIGHPDEYVEKLRNGCVIVDQNERKAVIIEKAKAEADKAGAVVRYSDDLLEEVTYLCEYPVAVTCNFDEEYLKIPQEVVVTVMACHQRYFALYKDGSLTNKFITITNYIGDEFENIKAGNLRVIKARLDDAVFFFKEDTKKPFEQNVETLKGVTFQKGMGSVYDKTMRIIELAKTINPSPTVLRTALLCKADLTTQLVFEFTELQGFIGADYARVSGEDAAVCEGIKEHYFPLGADSELAETVEGQTVGIADKVDTICAVFVEGKKPTGSSDPLGVRRAALGIIKTIINKQLSINLDGLIEKSLELLPVKKDCIDDITDFFTQRLVIYLADTYKKNILEACAANKNPLVNLCDYVERVKTFTEVDYQPLLESANRVIRILKDTTAGSVNADLFVADAESMLLAKINEINDNSDYKTCLSGLISANGAIEKFFEDVLVMDHDEKIKENRVALLSLLRKKYERLADFSKL